MGFCWLIWRGLRPLSLSRLGLLGPLLCLAFLVRGRGFMGLRMRRVAVSNLVSEVEKYGQR